MLFILAELFHFNLPMHVMRFFLSFFLLAITCCSDITATAQAKDTSIEKNAIDYRKQRDLVDWVYLFFHKNPDTRIDSAGRIPRFQMSGAPILEYTTATGITGGLDGNLAFTVGTQTQTNTSNFLGAVKFTQKKQFLLPVQSVIWTEGNKYKFAGDWRYLDYPQDTYGLGGHTSLDDKYIVGYKYLRFYELVLRDIGRHFYIGAGYQLDYHWNISESDLQPGRITDFQKYGFNASSTSSGISCNLVYDSRKNSINPEAGSAYGNIQFLQNARAIGANSNWSSVMIDLRKYISMPYHTVLAFWMYGSFTVAGNPPYLDLPATASDTYGNTGRGYEQNRFSGKNMIDIETELRFVISRNGLVGGVVFANAESFSEPVNNRFEVLSPAVGFGLRIKLNKFSATNVCFDYGIGTRGSHGFAGNLGEVF